jgi:hypothetical protein
VRALGGHDRVPRGRREIMELMQLQETASWLNAPGKAMHSVDLPGDLVGLQRSC